MDSVKQLKPIVFFDGNCPLCSKEIKHYMRCDGADDLNWIDLNVCDDLYEEFGIKQEKALQIFHVRDAKGDWQLGVDGFILVWQKLKYYRWLARFVLLTGMRRPLVWLYARFAKKRWDRIQKKGRCCNSTCAN